MGCVDERKHSTIQIKTSSRSKCTSVNFGWKLDRKTLFNSLKHYLARVARNKNQSILYHYRNDKVRARRMSRIKA